MYIYIFSGIALFILLTACINFMNLATARSANRAREVGLRKVVGAKRKNVIGQFYGESSFVVLLALLLSIVIVPVSLPYFNNLTSKELSISSLFSWQIISLLIAAFVITSIVSGSYPAIYLSSFQPVKVLKGSLKAGAKNAAFRKVLVSFQFVLTIGLIIGTFVINQQLRYVRTKNMGFDKEQLVYIHLPSAVQSNTEVLKNEFKKIPSVEDMSFSFSMLTGNLNSVSGFDWEGRTSDQEIKSYRLYTDENFLKTYDIKMVEGRFFSSDFTSDSLESVIVNETFLAASGMKKSNWKNSRRKEDCRCC